MPTDRTSRQSQVAYVSFDTVPAPKGASIHIEAFTRALAGTFGPLELATVSGAIRPGTRVERWPGVFHTELPAAGVSLIDRVLCFRHFLDSWLGRHKFSLIQFRSIFEGIPLLKLRPRPRLIFEVNGLPSIELKYRYPKIVDDRELMRKLVAQEQACLKAADRIVTPSSITRNYLAGDRGIDAAKIRVIPNGVDTRLFRACEGPPQHEEEMKLLYFGTLASWQGLEMAIRAVAQICSIAPASLTVLGAGNSSQRGFLAGLASKLGIASRVEIRPAVEQVRVVEALHQSFAALAPLEMNDRNLVQGCCPLKVLEGMAAGVPVIASDLPVVRELGEAERHFLLVKAGSANEMTEAVLRLRASPNLRRRLWAEGRTHIESNYTWERSGAALAGVCEELGMTRSSML